MAPVEGIDVALRGIGVQPEHRGKVHRVAGVGGGGLFEDTVLAEAGQGGVLAGDPFADPPGADWAVLERAQLRQQQVPVGCERPAPGAVGQVAGDRVPGELVQETALPGGGPARTSHTPAKGPASRKGPEVASGSTSQAAFAIFDAATCSWRPSPRSARLASAGPRRPGRARV